MKGGGFIFQAAQCALVSKKDGSRVPVYDASGVAEAASVLYPARTKNQIETIWAFLVDKIDQAHCRHCKSDDRTQTRDI